jgi:hypothetical protein
VEGVAPVPTAEFTHLNALTVVDLVLGSDVVTALALLTGEGHLDALLILCHDLFSFTDSSLAFFSK